MNSVFLAQQIATFKKGSNERREEDHKTKALDDTKYLKVAVEEFLYTQ